MSIGCQPTELTPKIASKLCPGIVLRYTIVVVTDALTDVVLVIFPTTLCWQLQMHWTLKAQVFVVFAFRLPLVIFASLFLSTWKQSLPGDNPGVCRGLAITYQQAEICISLIAATIPCLKKLLEQFDTRSSGNIGISSNRTHSNTHTVTSTQGNIDGYALSHMEDELLRSESRISRSDSLGISESIFTG